MKLTLNKASTAIWMVVASLLLVTAIIAAYTVFFREQPSARDSACKQSSQNAKNLNSTAEGVSIADAICQGTAQ